MFVEVAVAYNYLVTSFKPCQTHHVFLSKTLPPYSTSLCPGYEQNSKAIALGPLCDGLTSFLLMKGIKLQFPLTFNLLSLFFLIISWETDCGISLMMNLKTPMRRMVRVIPWPSKRKLPIDMS